MNFDTLNQYLRGEIKDVEFLKEIEKEVSQFVDDIEPGHNSIQIEAGELSYREFGSGRLRALLYKYLEGELGEWDLEYILRAIEFEFEEEDEKVENVIFSFSDPYLNFNITAKNISTAIQYLSGCSEVMSLEGHRPGDMRKSYKSVLK